MSKVEKIKAKIERLKESLPWGSCASQISMECNCKNEAYNEVLSYINSLEEEPISNDLEEAANSCSSCIYLEEVLSDDDKEVLKERLVNTFKAGAQWQKANLWKNAQGNDLPEIDREVIVLYQPYPCEGNEYAVSFAHRPPERWYGRNLDGEEHVFEPKTYDKGEWNIPNVVWWLDLDLPIKGE